MGSFQPGFGALSILFAIDPITSSAVSSWVAVKIGLWAFKNPLFGGVDAAGGVFLDGCCNEILNRLFVFQESKCQNSGFH